jgi:hypothetical protein
MLFYAYIVDASHREVLSVKVSSKLELGKNGESYFTEDSFLHNPLVQKGRLLFQIIKEIKQKLFLRFNRAEVLLSGYTVAVKIIHPPLCRYICLLIFGERPTIKVFY